MTRLSLALLAIFACARIAGWRAPVIEQYKDAALVRPKSEYIGPRGLVFPPAP